MSVRRGFFLVVAVLAVVSSVLAWAARQEVVPPAIRYSATLEMLPSGAASLVPASRSRSVSVGSDEAGTTPMMAYVPFRIRFMEASTTVLRAEVVLPYRYSGPKISAGRYVVRAVSLPAPFRVGDMVSPPDFPGTHPVEFWVPGGGSSGTVTVDVTALAPSIRPAEWVWLRLEPDPSMKGNRVVFDFTPARHPELRVGAL